MDKENSLYIDSETETDDIMEFVRERTENPIRIDDTVIFNFSSYEIQDKTLRRAVRTKLQKDKYIIPFQVTGTWGYLYYLLPDNLKEAEILVYHPDKEDYFAYRNFYDETSIEREEEFRRSLSKILEME